MSSETESLVIEILRKIQSEQAEIRRENREVKATLANHSQQFLAIRREILEQTETLLAVDVKVGLLSDRVERIERRLDLVDA
ncbi:hypothetical protein FACS1894205_4520 [Alphaproteobacteria bacterium]|nr:hypothetical protein FACS1894205_4520 [Alphaproteobacteria bacterium]